MAADNARSRQCSPRAVVAATETRPAIALPQTQLFIDGRWQEAAAGASLLVEDPATEDVICEVAAASAEDVDRAVAAARRQLDGDWAGVSGPERGRILNRLADLLEQHADEFASLEALEVGKPRADPRAVDIPLAIETFRHFAGWADKIHGQAVSVPDFFDGRSRHCYTRREPVGVVAAITPWNAPTMIASWKLAPALAAGCAVVLKPPEDAPLSALRLAELFEEAGLPPGVLNVLPGLGDVAGAALTCHPGVDKISFTGSPEVGREIGRVAAASFKRVTLELGGKSPQIIFPDADLETAVATAAMSFWANQGEICAAGTRILVERSIQDDVVSGVAESARNVRVGNPFDEQTQMGALINAAQLDRVLGYVQSGVDEGAELLAGGNRLDGRGYFVEPTVFLGRNDQRIAREEIFGPVGTVIPFDDPEDAIRLANETSYGLLAVVWTKDVARAHTTAARLRAGAVWVNAWGPPDPRLPWGGFKSSGVGRELGYAGIEAYTEEKAIVVVL